jgi:acyl dehydratase
MTDTTATEDAVRRSLDRCIGQPLGAGGPAVAPDPVNLPMIRHWVDALDDRNPVYLDEEVAARSRFGGIVAPPAMLQTWTMARPRMEGIAARGGAPESPLGLLAAAGYTATLATNSELEFLRYLRVGDQISSSAVLESVSERKATALGTGYFVTWVTDYRTNRDELVGRQRFRVFRFAPGSPTTAGTSRRHADPSPAEAPDPQTPTTQLPPSTLDVTATVIVAGAIASRDFMPAHHDRDYAQAQGAPDLFMNILTTNGYLSRYITDWAGPEAMLERISVRLGGPSVPGHPLHFSGEVTGDQVDADVERQELAVRAVTDLGAHATGTVTLTLPRG